MADSSQNVRSLLNALAKKQRDIRAPFYAAMERVGREAVDYLNANHPWVRRTGTLEANTTATVVSADGVNKFDLSLLIVANTDYARYLEYKNGGKHAWFHRGIFEMAPMFTEALMRAGKIGFSEAQQSVVTQLPNEYDVP